MKKLFLCTCNKTLDKMLDFAAIKKELEGTVDEVITHDSLCLSDGLALLKGNLEDGDVALLGACTSQIIGPSIADTLGEIKYAIVPLREHVAWVHKDDTETASGKASVLLADAASWIDFIEPKTSIDEGVVDHVLVIGGGIAGLKAASDLLQLGIGVTITEPPGWDEEKYLEVESFIDNPDVVSKELKKLVKSSKKSKKINCTVTKVEGEIGRFQVTLNCDGKEEVVVCGAIIVATPPEQIIPAVGRKLQYGKSDRVIPISELDNSERTKETILIAVDPTHQLTKVEGANLLRTAAHAAEGGNTVVVTYQDIRTDDEDLYRSARRAGAIFIRGEVKKVQDASNGLSCVIANSLESTNLEFSFNTIAIQTMTKPSKMTASLANVLDVELDSEGFVKTRYSKMKPVQTSRRGIYIVGNAKMPMNLSEALASAQNAALESYKIVRSNIKRSGWIPVVNEEACDVCKACTESCPNDALRILDNKVVHIPAHCEFCAICVSACPTRAIEFQSFSKESWFARLGAISTTHRRIFGDTPFTLIYACSECANASIDQAGFAGIGYSPHSYVIQVPCAGMVSPIELLKGLVEGAERVIVAHCPPGGCHHQSGDNLSELVVQLTREMLTQIGQDPERVRATYMIAALPNRMKEEVG